MITEQLVNIDRVRFRILFFFPPPVARRVYATIWIHQSVVIYYLPTPVDHANKNNNKRNIIVAPDPAAAAIGLVSIGTSVTSAESTMRCATGSSLEKPSTTVSIRTNATFFHVCSTERRSNPKSTYSSNWFSFRKYPCIRSIALTLI